MNLFVIVALLVSVVDRLPAEDISCMAVCQQLVDLEESSPDLFGPKIVLPIVASPPPAVVPHSPLGGDWRGLITTHFQPQDIDRALAVIWCESRGDPSAKNPTSTATGLWQHLRTYWEGRSTAAGIPGASIWDPEASTIVAAWLVYEGGGWSHWNPSKGCWQ